MADRVLMISWGETVRGREERAIEVFNEAVGLYGRMAQDGRIAGFDLVLLDPTAGLHGYATLIGSAAQLAAVREDADFRRTMVDAQLIVDDLRLVTGYAGQGIADQMALFTEATARVPQRA